MVTIAPAKEASACQAVNVSSSGTWAGKPTRTNADRWEKKTADPDQANPVIPSFQFA